MFQIRIVEQWANETSTWNSTPGIQFPEDSVVHQRPGHFARPSVVLLQYPYLPTYGKLHSQRTKSCSEHQVVEQSNSGTTGRTWPSSSFQKAVAAALQQLDKDAVDSWLSWQFSGTRKMRPVSLASCSNGLLGSPRSQCRTSSTWISVTTRLPPPCCGCSVPLLSNFLTIFWIALFAGGIDQ